MYLMPGSQPPAHDHAVAAEEHHRADDGREEAGRLLRAIPPRREAVAVGAARGRILVFAL
jgi:hypothetical protein